MMPMGGHLPMMCILNTSTRDMTVVTSVHDLLTELPMPLMTWHEDDKTQNFLCIPINHSLKGHNGQRLQSKMWIELTFVCNDRQLDNTRSLPTAISIQLAAADCFSLDTIDFNHVCALHEITFACKLQLKWMLASKQSESSTAIWSWRTASGFHIRFGFARWCWIRWNNTILIMHSSCVLAPKKLNWCHVDHITIVSARQWPSVNVCVLFGPVCSMSHRNILCHSKFHWSCCHFNSWSTNLWCHIFWQSCKVILTCPSEVVHRRCSLRSSCKIFFLTAVFSCWQDNFLDSETNKPTSALQLFTEANNAVNTSCWQSLGSLQHGNSWTWQHLKIPPQFSIVFWHDTTKSQARWTTRFAPSCHWKASKN